MVVERAGLQDCQRRLLVLSLLPSASLPRQAPTPAVHRSTTWALHPTRPPAHPRHRRLKYFEEVFTSEHWMMRVYRVLDKPNRDAKL